MFILLKQHFTCIHLYLSCLDSEYSFILVVNSLGSILAYLPVFAFFCFVLGYFYILIFEHVGGIFTVFSFH